MGGLKPIGSEKLQGMDKINRILEIARYNENIPNPVNETKSSEYSVNLSDGRTYEIVKERNGYIIKQQLSEGVTEYIEPMKNRKYYSSYSQAFKRLNLVAKELNSLHENRTGTALFEGDKKYYLKTTSGLKKTDEPVGDEIEEQAPPAPAPAPAPAPVPPAPAPAPIPAPSAPSSEPTDIPLPDEGDMEEEPMDTEGEEKSDEEVTFKTIQKLTGKLAQKIRDFDSQIGEDEEGMDANDIKYVINSILSALDLDALEEDDKDEIISRIEGEEEGEEGMAPEEGGMEGEEGMAPEEGGMEGEVPPPAGGEMAEMMSFKDALMTKIPSVYGSNIGKKMGFKEEDEFDMDDYDDDDMSIHVCTHCQGLGMDDLTGEDCEWCGGSGEEGATHRKSRGARKHFTHGTFSESTIDNIITKYFDVEENDKKLNESINNTRVNLNEIKSEIRRLSQNISQERSAIKFLSENKNSELIGLTNKKNLIFRLNKEDYKITPTGRIR
jgi:hypothetical protein